jgi:hypothetical protein
MKTSGVFVLVASGPTLLLGSPELSEVVRDDGRKSSTPTTVE